MFAVNAIILSAWLEMTRSELVMAVLTAIYVGITGFYALTSHKTLKAIEKQGELAESLAEDNANQFAEQIAELKTSAEAAKQSAGAAQISADSIINSERAWILENINFPKTLEPQPVAGQSIECQVAYTFKNFGRTPARITDARIRFHAVRELTQLGSLPIWNPNLTFKELGESGVVVPQGDTFQIASRFEGAWFDQGGINDIYGGKLILCSYGMIEYRDIFEKQRYTYFCYLYHVPRGFDMAPEGFTRAGPPAYNRAT